MSLKIELWDVVEENNKLQKHRTPEIITRNMPKLGTKFHFLGYSLLG